MAVSQVQKVIAEEAAGADSITATWPSGAPTDGNLLIGFMACRGGDINDPHTWPAGWTVIARSDHNATAPNLWGGIAEMAYKVASSEGTSVTVTAGPSPTWPLGNADLGLWVAEYSGLTATPVANTPTPTEAESDTESTSETAPSITPGVSSSLLIAAAVVRQGGDDGSFSFDSSFTVQDDQNTSDLAGTNQDIGFGWGHRIVTSDGSYGTTATWTDAGRRFVVLAAFEASGGDTTAPTLSSASASATGATAADGSVSTDEGNGTLYWIVDQSATPPSVAQIQAGQGSDGVAADASGSQAVSATGTQNVSAAGLTASTTYYFHFQQADAAANDSTVVSSASFTTDATIPGGTPGTKLGSISSFGRL